MPSIFIIDNYDSFTYNLVHLVEQLEVEYSVKRNDDFELPDVERFSHILIGPGPGLPSESGKLMDTIETYGEAKPILGVCLGMQGLLESAGGKMTNMKTVQHGAMSVLAVQRPSRLFKSLPDQIKVGRYHSWAFEEENVPSSYQVTAQAEDGLIMAVEHRQKPLIGVQFHPESIMTEFGLDMLRNWLVPQP